jgi:quercetin dioxygenase-like cupin family protein
MHKIELAQAEWETPMPGMRQKKIVANNKVIRLVEYSEELPFHWCTKGHIGYVIDGELEIHFEKNIERYKAGDCIFIPHGANHKHAGKVITKKVNIFFVENAD